MLPIKSGGNNRDRFSALKTLARIVGAEIHYRVVTTPQWVILTWILFAATAWLSMDFYSRINGKVAAGIFMEVKLDDNKIIELNNDTLTQEVSVQVASMDPSFEEPVEDKMGFHLPSFKKEENEAAPDVTHIFTGEANPEEYIRRYAKTAQNEMAKYRIPASISLAQGIIESRSGTSKLARSNNNHFGIKCFSAKCRAGHCTNFKDDTHKDFFRKFKTPWESWREHSLVLRKSRYKKLYSTMDYRKWAYGLEAARYATDRSYAEKLIGIIQKYKLYKYDR